VSTTTIAHPAPLPTPEKRRRTCAACGEPSGSISTETGYPVVRERESGLYFHVRCRPGTPSGKAAVAFAGVL
jgi:hypothetical protein